MSEMPIGSDENPFDEALFAALAGFTTCVGSAVQPICSYGLTIGETYVPFDPDPDDEDNCDADEHACSQLWVRVTGVDLKEMPESFEGDSCGTALEVGLEVGVLRCVNIPEDGEAPTATDVMVSAFEAMTDMRAIMCAALGCDVWQHIIVGSWSPEGPMGGQAGGLWTFTVEI